MVSKIKTMFSFAFSFERLIRLITSCPSHSLKPKLILSSIISFKDLAEDFSSWLEVLLIKFSSSSTRMPSFTATKMGLVTTLVSSIVISSRIRRFLSSFNSTGILTSTNRDSGKLSASLAKIDEILNVLTTKNLALDFCRNKAEKICDELSINVLDAMSFELYFENSLDDFKDLKQGEHQKIIRFSLLHPTC